MVGRRFRLSAIKRSAAGISTEELPENCKKFITFVETTTSIKIDIISVGSDRIQTIYDETLIDI